MKLHPRVSSALRPALRSACVSGLATVLVTILIVSALLAHRVFAADGDIAPPNEAQARHLDEEALQAKRTALRSFQGLVPRSHGTAQEPVFLLREAEMIQDIGAIQYRLIFGSDKGPDKSDKKFDLSSYQKTMRESLIPLNQIVTSFPKFEKLPHAIRMRAKAYQELGFLEESLHDLRLFVANWPTNPEASLAYNDLWSLLIEKKYDEEAVHYINAYGLRPTDKYYHVALDNLAWCNYFLGSVSQSIQYTETALKTSKGVEREKALSNFALFYATGVEKKDPSTPSDQALARFKKSFSGDELEKIAIAYAYLLRSKASDAALEQFKTAAYSDSSLPNTGRSDLLILTSENELNRQMYSQLKITINQELELIRKVPEMKKNAKVMDKAKASLASSAQVLQKNLSLPNQTPNPEVASILGICYQFLTDVSQGNVLEQGRLHYNIAEAALIAKDTDGAIRNYRWIVDNFNMKASNQKDLYVLASVKALDVRYHVIQDKGFRPAELSAKSFDSSPKELPPAVKEWISWVDQVPADALPAKAIFEQKFDVLLFESNRILYGYGHVAQSVQRLLAFVDKYPSSQSAIPSAALVIDTEVASKKWVDAYATAGKFDAVNEWKGSDFAKRLAVVIGDSYFNILNASYVAKDYVGTLKNAEDFLRKNPGNRRQSDFLELAANACLGLGDKTKAALYFKQLAQQGGEKKEVAALGFMTDGSVAEDHFDFGTASDSYRKLVESGAQQGQGPDLRRKVLLFAWLSGDAARLNTALASRALCPNDFDVVCKEYKNRDARTSSVAIALNRLKAQKRLAFKTRSDLLKQIAQDWSHQTPVEQQVLIAEVSDELPGFLHELREDVRKDAHVTFDQSSIQRRVKLMEQLQIVSESVASLPITRVQVAAQLEAAGSNQDMVQDLRSIKKPKGLSAEDAKDVEKALEDASEPFAKKRDDLKLASLKRIQESGSDSKTADLVYSTFKGDGTLADNRSGKESAEQSYAFESGLLAGMSTPTSEAGRSFAAVFQSQVQHTNRPQVGFLIQMASEQHLVSETDLSLMKALLLEKSGLIPEAAGELRSHLSSYDSKAKEKANAAIWTAYSVFGANDSVAKNFDQGGKLVSIAQRAVPTRMPASVSNPALAPGKKGTP